MVQQLTDARANSSNKLGVAGPRAKRPLMVGHNHARDSINKVWMQRVGVHSNGARKCCSVRLRGLVTGSTSAAERAHLTDECGHGGVDRRECQGSSS